MLEARLRSTRKDQVLGQRAGQTASWSWDLALLKETDVTLSNLPHWVLAVLAVSVLVAGNVINNRFFSWCRSHYPWMLGPKALLAIFALGLMTIAFGLWINPPSKLREDLQRAHPELFSKSGNDFKSGH
jgi:hypothetical protein